MRYLILSLLLLTVINPPVTTQSFETKQNSPVKLSSEYERECGKPLDERMKWTSIGGKVSEVVGSNTFILLMASDKRKHVSLAGVSDEQTLAAKALLSLLVLNQEVTVLVNPNNATAQNVAGVVQAQTKDVNREMIEAGASRYQPPAPYVMSDHSACVYRIVERQAREDGRGLWAQQNTGDYPADLSAPDAKFFREKLGEPAQVYRHKSGVNVQIAYDNKDQACNISITDPRQHRYPRDFSRLLAVANELVPESSRGPLRGRTGSIGNCIQVEYKDYERVFLLLNQDACYEQGIQILFKRPSCPKPPKVQGLTIPRQ